MAAEYGLDIHVQSTMASFFDYDNDGDLDMYLTVNEASNGVTNPFLSNALVREPDRVSGDYTGMIGITIKSSRFS